MPTTYSYVTPPPGASSVDEWQPGPPPWRVVLGLAHTVGGVEIQPSIIQFQDGDVDRVGLVELPHVHVRSAEHTLTVAQARDLAAALFSAAFTIKQWTEEGTR